MSERKDSDFLADILEAAERILSYTTDLDYDDFLGDTKTQDAVIRNLEIIGEAVKRISPALRKEHAELPWQSMAGLRDRLIHDYFGVNVDIVWEIISRELEGLIESLKAITGDAGNE
jgi:uncharacterized protein with HEPN domain